MAKKFKNIKIKKKGGGTRMQRVQVLKSGKFKFVKNTKKGGGKKSTKRKSTTRKKSTTKKKTTKKRTTTKSKGSGNVGKKTSAMSPINKKGLKVVTAMGLLALVAAVFTAPEGTGESPYSAARRGDYTRAGAILRGQVTRPSLAKSFAVAAVVTAGTARALNVKSISFVQFS